MLIVKTIVGLALIGVSVLVYYYSLIKFRRCINHMNFKTLFIASIISCILWVILFEGALVVLSYL